jgi:molybdopterin-guanine dinucleotide biosynthesis protein A
MGRDKAGLPYRGATLGEAVAQAVTEAVGTAVLVGKGGGGYKWIPDLYPGEGPLGGVLTALADTAAEWNLIVACDLPELTPEFLRNLMKTAEACAGDVVVPTSPRGLEPLCAAYHHRSGAGLRAAFESGVRKVAAALQEVRMVTMPVAEITLFQNVNTPEEWAPYAQ